MTDAVVLIYRKETNTVVGVVESIPTMTNDEIKKRWLATHGCTIATADQFRCDFAPVIPASKIQKFEPLIPN